MGRAGGCGVDNSLDGRIGGRGTRLTGLTGGGGGREGAGAVSPRDDTLSDGAWTDFLGAGGGGGFFFLSLEVAWRSFTNCRI